MKKPVTNRAFWTQGAFAVATALLGWGALAPDAALAGPRDNTLNFALARETDYVDRIHTNSTDSSILSALIYDTLLYTDPQTGRTSGLLAKSWTWTNDRTIEFELREGVKFHNGEAFDADDVAYTVGFAIDPANKLRQQDADFGNIASVEKLGPYKVRLNLKRTEPTTELILASRLIMWPDQYTKSSGHEIHGTKPIGTGPFKAVSVTPGSGYKLARNDDYFSGGPRPKGGVANINIRVIPEAQTQIGELLAGQLDLSFSIPADEAEALKSRLTVAYGGTTRYTFVSFDAAGRTGDNPLKNVKVRQAITQAIDRNAIATRLAGGGAAPIKSQCSPAQQFCPQDIDAPAFDPARAKALLAEAGFPQGLDIAFISSADLRPIGEAIQGYLAAVGVRAKYDTFTLPAWRDKLLKGESTMSLLGWGGSGAVDADYAVRIFYDGGNADYVRNAALTDKMKGAASIVDRAARERAYREFFTEVNQQAFTAPLFSNGAVYVMSSSVDYAPPKLDSPDLTWVKWK